jgi:hypothetical protein
MTIAIFTTSPFVVCAGPCHGKMAASRGAMLLYVVFRVELNYTGKLDLMRTRSSFFIDGRVVERKGDCRQCYYLVIWVSLRLCVCVCVCVGTNSLSSSIPIKKEEKKKLFDRHLFLPEGLTNAIPVCQGWTCPS